jgi:hypothetical protein
MDLKDEAATKHAIHEIPRRIRAVIFVPLKVNFIRTPHLIIRTRRISGITTSAAVTCFQKSFSLNMHLMTSASTRRTIPL